MFVVAALCMRVCARVPVIVKDGPCVPCFVETAVKGELLYISLQRWSNFLHHDLIPESYIDLSGSLSCTNNS